MGRVGGENENTHCYRSILRCISFHVRFQVQKYWVFNQNEELVTTGIFSTDASARRWFIQRGFKKPGWTLNRELNDEMIEVVIM